MQFGVEHFLYLAFPVLVLAAPLTSTAQQEQDRIHCRLSIELVMLTVTVTDANGHPVTNLTHDDFFVTDRNHPQNIDYFSREDRPRSVGIVISESTAAHVDRVKSILQNIRSFKEQSHEMNEYFIVAAGGSPQIVTDWTRDRDALADGLNNGTSTDAAGESAVYDACALANAKLDERGTFESVILLFSDGEDASQWSYTDLRESFKRSGALVYSIVWANQRAAQGSAQAGLKKLAAVSGGASYVVSSANEVSEVLGRIATELQHQYVIGYYPVEAQRDGTWHRVKVMAYSQTDGRSDPIPLVVRSRSGYNAPNEPVSSQQD